MQTIITMVDGLVGFVSILGLSLSAVFFAYAGILFITSHGDPQKVAQARGAMVGAFVGTIIIGIAFLLPGVASRLIVEPAGSYALYRAVSEKDCDGLLRQNLVSQTSAITPYRMNLIVDYIQGRYETCTQNTWDPVVNDADPVGAARISCGQHSLSSPPTTPFAKIGALTLPPGLSVSIAPLSDTRVPLTRSHRDGAGNILIYWHSNSQPWDGSSCWVYFVAFDTWRAS